MTASTITDITVRDATEADLPFLVEIMFAAQRSHLERGVVEYLVDLPPDATRDFLARMAVAGSAHMFHLSRFRIAEIDGEPAAGLCTFDRDEHLPATNEAMVTVLQHLGMDPADPE